MASKHEDEVMLKGHGAIAILQACDRFGANLDSNLVAQNSKVFIIITYYYSLYILLL